MLIMCAELRAALESSSLFRDTFAEEPLRTIPNECLNDYVVKQHKRWVKSERPYVGGTDLVRCADCIDGQHRETPSETGKVESQGKSTRPI